MDQCPPSGPSDMMFWVGSKGAFGTTGLMSTIHITSSTWFTSH
uniref:Uncharacterized protein n=1 Tax=Moniliophthora roreri TaxID=221103 RepID=A0A0W0G662_MONRR